MSAPSIELPCLEIGQDGKLTLIGENKGIATMKVEGLAFAHEKTAVRKISEKFHGTCIFTNPWGTHEPCFIFTVNAGEAIKNQRWFLGMVRKQLLALVPEVDLLTRE